MGEGQWTNKYMVYRMVTSARKKVFTCCHFVVSHQEKSPRTSLAIHPLRLCASTAGNPGSVSDRGNRIPHALHCSQKVRRERKKEIPRFHMFNIWKILFIFSRKLVTILLENWSCFKFHGCAFLKHKINQSLLYLEMGYFYGVAQSWTRLLQLSNNSRKPSIRNGS